MLDLSRVRSGYGETQILHGVDLHLEKGRIAALLGRNGAGKSTLLKTIMGLLPLRGGEICYQGQSLGGMPAYAIARKAIAYVPESCDIFPSLTVAENLQIALQPGYWDMSRILEFFPQLKPRLAHGGRQLSGGEQKMLAIGRALAMNPQLLLLDEPSEGLAPIFARQLREKLSELGREGLTILLVEQNFAFATGLAAKVNILARGQIIWSGSSAAIIASPQKQAEFLGL